MNRFTWLIPVLFFDLLLAFGVEAIPVMLLGRHVVAKLLNCEGEDCGLYASSFDQNGYQLDGCRL